jgi:hypothetical protein
MTTNHLRPVRTGDRLLAALSAQAQTEIQWWHSMSGQLSASG